MSTLRKHKAIETALDVDAEFGQDVKWEEDPILTDPKAFYPSRFEWLFSGILSAVLTSAPPREYSKRLRDALNLAREAEEMLHAQEKD